MNLIPPSVKIPNPLFQFLSRPLQSFEYKMPPTGSRGWTVASHAGGIILRNSGNCRRWALGPWGHTLGMSCLCHFLSPLPFFSVTKKKISSSTTPFCHSDSLPKSTESGNHRLYPWSSDPKETLPYLSYNIVLFWLQGSIFRSTNTIFS